MASNQGFLSLSQSSIQLHTPSILTTNQAIFVYKAGKNTEKKDHAVVKEIHKNQANFGEAV